MASTPSTPDEFRASLSASQPPAGLTPALQSLWWDARGDWERAHACAQDDESPAGSWAHALLHRREGDLANAGYWYRRAGRPTGSGSLDAERDAIVAALLAAARA